MNCTDIRGLLSAYIDGETTPEEHRIVEEHLATCQDCRRVLAEYRAIGGEMRALSVPVPPAGLRRDVWRAIEAQQPARGATGVATTGAGKVTSIDRARERGQAPVTAETRKGWRVGRLLPAAGLVAAMIVLFAVALVANQRTTVQAATLLDKAPDYNAAVHVKFSKPVDGKDAVQYTLVSQVVDGTAAAVTVIKWYDAASWTLVISPDPTWVRGATYQVEINAPMIGTGVQGGYLGKDPVRDKFQIAVFTSTPTLSPTRTATVTVTSTATPVPPTATATPVVVAIPPTEVVQPPQPATETPAATDTPRPPEATATSVPPTHTASATPVPSSTPRPSNTPLPTLTSTPSLTPVVPTATLSSTPTHKPSTTPTPRTTMTATPKATSTATPKVTGTPSATPMPCSVVPRNGFGKLWRDNGDVRSRLGCATAEEWGIINAAEQHFQGGYMFWNGDTRTVYVFLDGKPSGTFYFFADTWADGDPTAVPVGTPPPGLYQPVRGFGKIWSAYPGLRQALGWATDQEAQVQAAWEPFVKGNMLWTGDGQIRVMYDAGTWSSFIDTFNTPTPVAIRPGE